MNISLVSDAPWEQDEQGAVIACGHVQAQPSEVTQAAVPSTYHHRITA